MTVDELLAKAKEILGEDPSENLQKIRSLSQEIRREPNAVQLTEALANLAFEQMPEDMRAEMEETTFAAGKRMDQTFAQAERLVSEGKAKEAEPLLRAISEKIAAHFESGEKKWFSFRNPFEYHTYRFLYPEDDSAFDRAPFDFAHYLTLYAFVLLECGKTAEARESLLRAIAFNPVGAEFRFEYAELCKIARNMPDLLNCCRETAPLCTNASRMARVCQNMGYYCAEVNELYAAAVFFFESMRLHPTKPVEAELQDVVKHMKVNGMKFVPPTDAQTAETFRHFGVMRMPNGKLVNLALTLAAEAEKQGRLDLEGLFMRTAYDMTNDSRMREELERIDREIAQKKGSAE